MDWAKGRKGKTKNQAILFVRPAIRTLSLFNNFK
jgi:hypothetical protein